MQDVDHCDVVVVGAGIAGLSAAWSLRELNVIVLEADDRVGGRMKSVIQPPYWLNLGAHVLSPDGPIARLAHAVGVELVVSPGYFMSVAMRGRIIKTRKPTLLPLLLPLSPASRLALARVGVRMRSSNRDGSSTLADRLGPLPPDVAGIVRVFANRMGGEPEELTARFAAVGFQDLFGGARANLVDGSEALPRALSSRLGDRVWCGAEVTSVRNVAREVEVVFNAPHGGRVLRASACIVATPAPITRCIVTDLTEQKAAALDKVRYTPFVVMGIFTDEAEGTRWDDVYAMAVPDRAFCMLFNPASVRRGPKPRQAGGSLVVYSVANRAAALLGLDDAAIRDLYLQDLYTILPEVRGHIVRTVVQKWPLGVPVSWNGRPALQEQLEAPTGRIHYAGDYQVYEGLGMDSSSTNGSEAAARVRGLVSA